MPRPTKSVPSYLHHKASGRAYCVLRRADGSREQVYLGPYGSEESLREYARVIGQDAAPAASDAAKPVIAPAGPVTVTELVVRFMEHAATHYRRPDGTQTAEVEEFRLSLRVLNHLFGALPVTEFTPKGQKKVRDLMVGGYDHPEYGPLASLCRNVVNARCSRVVRIFKWGVVEELVPETVHRATAVLERAIQWAASRAGVEHWSVNQLRHAFATRVREKLGLEEAQFALGHYQADVAQLYALKNESLAVKVAQQLG